MALPESDQRESLAPTATAVRAGVPLALPEACRKKESLVHPSPSSRSARHAREHPAETRLAASADSSTAVIVRRLSKK